MPVSASTGHDMAYRVRREIAADTLPYYYPAYAMPQHRVLTRRMLLL